MEMSEYSIIDGSDPFYTGEPIKQLPPYIVYVKTDSNGYITAVNSSAFLTNTAGWVEIDRGYGDKYHHAQGNYFPQPIITMGGAYRYKLVEGKLMECTAEEIAAQEEIIKAFITTIPTAEEHISELKAENETLLNDMANIVEEVYQSDIETLGI